MTLYRFALAFFLILLASPGHAVEVQLGNAVVVDPAQRLAWIASPEGRIAAVDLSNGVIRWNGPARGYPLAKLEAGLLVALPPDASGVWPLAWVNPNTGEVGERFAATLPAGVLANLDALPNQRFEVFVQADPGGVALHWFWQRRAFRGAMLEDDEGVLVREGVVRVEAASSRAFADTIKPERPRLDLSPEERLPGLGELQLRAADDRHVMQRNEVPDAKLGQRWRWEISHRSGGRVASVTLPEAAAPWMLDRNELLWVSRPMGITNERGELLALPARLIAIRLSDSTERWSVPLRDPVFRGSMPN